MNLSELIKEEGIVLDLKCENKNNVLLELVKLHKKLDNISDIEKFMADIISREQQSSTGIEEGIAIPHAKSKYVEKIGVTIIRTKEGIEYGALDDKKSNIFFMIAAPEGANNSHIEVLKQLSLMLIDEEIIEKLNLAKTPNEMYKIINSYETSKEEEKNDDDEYEILAVTACPTGIAHTFMAKESLEKSSKKLGIKIKVETNGAAGIENLLSQEEIKRAKAIIVAADRKVEMARFNGKKVIITSTKDAMKNSAELLKNAQNGNIDIYISDKINEKKESEKKGGYKHLMSGVSFMLPLVISGGIIIALAFLMDSLTGNSNVGSGYGSTSEVAKLLMGIGGAAFGLFIPILGGYIAYSIGDKPALAAGLVAGSLAKSGGSGFLGAILGGFLAGYVTNWLIKSLKKLPVSLNGIKAILLYPLISVLITGVTMVLLLNPPVTFINTAMENWLNSMNSVSRVILGLVLGGMMAVDMGGPVNKAAYVFGTGTLQAGAVGGTSVMAAVMAGGMVPPLAIALATLIFKNKFTTEEKQAGLSNWIMGLSFITEGAIPFAASDPIKVIPSMIVGSAIAGALTMLFNITLPAPHGGILVMLLSNNFFLYFVSIATGSVVSALFLGALKKNKN